MARLKKILDLLIEISYLGIIFLIPIFFAVFLPTNNIFELNKLVLFKILVLLLFSFSVSKILLFGYLGKILKFFDKKFIVVILFFLSLILATVFSINKEISFWGLYSRFQGLESYIYYLAFFVLIYLNLRLANNLKSKINNIVLVAFFSSFLVSVYAIAQYFGIDFFVWAEPALITKRAFSTLGQPNYLASYLLLIIPLSFYLLIYAKKFLLRFFILLILFFQILALIFSGSRGGILGLLFSLFVFGLIYLIYNLQKIKKIIKERKKSYYLISVGLSLLFISFLIFKGGVVVDRFGEMKDIKSGSVALRVEYWKASLDAFKQKPLFGYGLDTQKEIFAKYYQKDWGIYMDLNSVPHRAHNLFFDILLTTGIAGLIAYLALLYVFARLCIKVYKKNNEFSFLSICILAGISGYLFSLLFGFAIVVTQIYFWLYLAIILILDFCIKDRDKKPSFGYPKLGFCFRILILIFLTVLIFYQINQEFKYIKADYYFMGMKQSFQENNYFKTLEYWLYIKEENLEYNYYKNEGALIIANLTQKQKENIFKKPGQKELKEIFAKINSSNYSDIYLKAQIHWALSENEKAEKFFQEVINLSPEKEEAYREFARFYYLTGNVEKAIDYYQKALEYLPDFESAYINERHSNRAKDERSLIYKDLGDIYFDMEDYELSEEYYELALNDKPNNLAIIKKIADTYYKRGDFKTAIWYNEHGMLRNPNDYVWPYSIGLIYEEIGDNELAVEYYNKVLEILPENKFIQDKIKELNF